jgi:O-antigen ligase
MLVETKPVDEGVRAPATAPKSAPGAVESVLRWIAFGTAASIVVSIAVSQILLGAGIILLLVSRTRLRFPPIGLPLLLFMTWTLASDLLSGHPMSGLPQIRKFFVFAIILLIFNTFRGISEIRGLIVAWAAGATVSALFGIRQFAARWAEAIQLHAQPYDYVLDGRIKGLAGHWMTFGGQEMIALLMLVALLLFSHHFGPAAKALGWLCTAILWTVLVMGYTRSIFLLGVPAGLLVLTWQRRRWLILTLPLAAIATFYAAPIHIRERIRSVLDPHGDVDSNSRRSIMRRTGVRMMEAHPWFGLGPEQIQPQFPTWVPPDITRPLPIGWYGHLHNIYLQYAAERGLPALAFLLWMIAKMAVDFYRAAKQTAFAEGRWVFAGALSVIAAILAEGLFEHNLGDSEVLTMFLVVITCGYVALRNTSARETRCA